MVVRLPIISLPTLSLFPVLYLNTLNRMNRIAGSVKAAAARGTANETASQSHHSRARDVTYKHHQLRPPTPI